MRPTVDDVYSRRRSLYLKTLILRVYLLHVGYPWLLKTSALFSFLIPYNDFSHSIYYTHDPISRATYRTIRISVYVSDWDTSRGQGALMPDL